MTFLVLWDTKETIFKNVGRYSVLVTIDISQIYLFFLCSADYRFGNKKLKG